MGVVMRQRVLSLLERSQPETSSIVKQAGAGSAETVDGMREAWAAEPARMAGQAANTGLTKPVGWTASNDRTDVARVELLLGNLGYQNLAPAGGPTGYFGTPQQSAIKAFQRDQGLEVDGLVLPDGPTWSALTKLTRTATNAPSASRDAGRSPLSREGRRQSASGEQEAGECQDILNGLEVLNQRQNEINAALIDLEGRRERINAEIAAIDKEPAFDPKVMIPELMLDLAKKIRQPHKVIAELIKSYGADLFDEVMKERLRQELRARKAEKQNEVQKIDEEIQKLRARSGETERSINNLKSMLEACRMKEKGGDKIDVPEVEKVETV